MKSSRFNAHPRASRRQDNPHAEQAVGKLEPASVTDKEKSERAHGDKAKAPWDGEPDRASPAPGTSAKSGEPTPPPKPRDPGGTLLL